MHALQGGVGGKTASSSVFCLSLAQNVVQPFLITGTGSRSAVALQLANGSNKERAFSRKF